MNWKRSVSAFAAALFLAAPGAPAARVAVDSQRGLPRVVTLDGVAGVVPGLSAAEVSSRWGIAVRPRGGASAGCPTATINVAGVRGYALFERGRLGAVFFERGVRTPSRIRIGSTVSQLKRAYG